MDLDKPKRIRRTKEQMQQARTQYAEPTLAVETVKYSEPSTTNGAFVKSQDTRAQEIEKLHRVYANAQLLDHDLYKLEVANLVRNASYNNDRPILENVEHGHFFHSIDSRGQPQTHCNKVGGHFHEVTLDKSGKATCGPAIREVKIRRHGRTMTKYEMIADDNHTHAVTYRFSEKIKPSTANMEFAKMQSRVIESETRATSVKIPDLIDSGD